MKILKRCEADPRVASTDLEIDERRWPNQFADATTTRFRVRTCTHSREQFENGLGARGPPPASAEVLGCSYRHFDGSQTCDIPIPR
jgi:hypothetical protein